MPVLEESDPVIEQIKYDDENDFIVEIIEYYYDDRIAKIKEYQGNKKEILIPPNIQNAAVVSIEKFAFYDRGITNVIIPDTVYEIGDGAFLNNQITHLNIPEGVRTIGDMAFRWNRLTDVTFGSGIRQIGQQAFADNQLAKVTFPESEELVSFDSEAFKNNKIVNITLPYYAYLYDDSIPGLANFYYQNGGRAGEYTWDGENWIGVISPYNHSIDFDVVIIDNMGEYPLDGKIWGDIINSLFPAISNNKAIFIRKYWKEIPKAKSRYFSSATSHTTGNRNVINIPPQIRGLPVTVIGGDAFNDVPPFITSVTIPDSVIIIVGGAFYRCELSSIVIPNSVKAIGDFAFAGNKLTDLVIPDSVKIIGQRTFIHNNLKNVVINAEFIDSWAFQHNKIESIILGDNVTTIYHSAFVDNMVTSITIPANVSLDKYSFDNGFDEFYNTNGKTEGTYIWNGSGWSKYIEEK
jgi:hypothetical protein